MAAATAAAAAGTTRPCPRKAGGAGRTRTVALRAELRSNVCTGLATGKAEVPSALVVCPLQHVADRRRRLSPERCDASRRLLPGLDGLHTNLQLSCFVRI